MYIFTLPHVQSEAVIPDVIRIVNLTGWVQSCQAFRLEMTVKIGGYFLTAEYEAGSKSKWPLDDAKATSAAICRGVKGGTLERYFHVFRLLFGRLP